MADLRAIPGLELVEGVLETGYYRQDQGEIPGLLEDLFVRGPEAIVRPADGEAIGRLLDVAARRGVPVVPRGAASFPLGGTLPVLGGIGLDLSLYRKVLEIDAGGLRARVEAGTRWDDLDRALAGRGLGLLAYPTSRFSTVAGWVATGGYGVGSVRYGPFVRQVEEIEVVTPGHGPRRLTPSDEDFETFFGSEGQLGVVSSVTVRVRRRPDGTYPVLLTMDSCEQAFVEALSIADGEFSPFHLIYLSPERMAVENRLAGGEHFAKRHGVLAAVETREAESRLKEWALTRPGVAVAPLYHGTLLWHQRFFPLRAKRLGPGLLAAEVVLPGPAAPAYLAAARREAMRFGIDLETEAYFLDGGRVLAITPFLADPSDRWRYLLCLGLVAVLTALGVKRGGRPYGLGFWNQGFATQALGPRLSSMLRAKARLDPDGILNPGKWLSASRKPLGWLVFGPPARLGVGLLEWAAPWLVRLATRPGAPVEGPPAGLERVLWESRQGCSRCGACVTVCPAYLTTRDEMVTARGKLYTAVQMARGRLPEREAQRMFFCMHCRACQEVCQSELPLMECWDQLEAWVGRDYGRPTAAIEAFVSEVERQPDYQVWIDQNVHDRSNPDTRAVPAAQRPAAGRPESAVGRAPPGWPFGGPGPAGVSLGGPSPAGVALGGAGRVSPLGREPGGVKKG